MVVTPATDAVADLFRRVRKPCSSVRCTRKVETYKYVQKPRCRPCRRRMASLGKARAATCWPPDLMLGRFPTDSETAGQSDLFGAKLTGESRATYGRKTEGEA